MSEAAAPAGDIPPFRYTAALADEIEPRWQDLWARERHLPRAEPDRPAGRPDPPAGRRAEAVRAGHVPVPVRRGPARRPPAGLHRHRLLRPLPADGRPQRAARDGLRRVRPARRAVRGADRHPPADHHRGEHRAVPRRSCAGWAWRYDDRRSVATTDPDFYRWTQWIFLQIFNSWYDPDAGKARPIAELVAEFEAGDAADPGRPGLGRADRRRAPPGRRRPPAGVRLARRRSTGARAWAPCWPTRRSPPTAAPSAATSRSSSAT